MFGTPEALFDVASLLYKNGCGRSLGDECEGTVRINGDDDGDDKSHVILCSFVEFLGEYGDCDTVLTESRTDRRLRSSLAGGKLKFDVTYNFLCHY